MDQTDIILRLGLSAAVGFLIGLERGWREREEEEGHRTAWAERPRIAAFRS